MSRHIAVRQANRQALLVSRYERQSVNQLTKFMVSIQKRARSQGANFVVSSSELQPLVEYFAKVQLFLYAESVIQARKFIEAKTRLELAAPKITADMLRQLDDKNLNEIGRQMSQDTQAMFAKMTTSLTDGVRDAVRDAVTSGLPVKSAVDHYFSKSGVTGTSPHRFTTLVRTQLQLVMASAAQEEYNSTEVNEILWGYEYVTVGDDRVREEHEAIDGVRLPKDDPFWKKFFPPNGWNCRCQAVPIFEQEEIVRPPAGREDFADRGFDFAPGAVTIKPIETPAQVVKPSEPKKPRAKKPAEVKMDKYSVPQGAVYSPTSGKQLAGKIEYSALYRLGAINGLDREDVFTLTYKAKNAEEQLKKLELALKKQGKVMKGFGPTAPRTREVVDTQKLNAIQKAYKDGDIRKAKALSAEMSQEIQRKQSLASLAASSSTPPKSYEVSSSLRAEGKALTARVLEGPQAKEAEKYLNSQCDRSLLHIAVKDVKAQKGVRAYCSTTSITMAPNDKATVWIHETGHAIEHSLSIEGKNECREFLLKRKGDEQVTEVYPGSEAHKGEKGIKDGFVETWKTVTALSEVNDRDNYSSSSAKELLGHYTGKIYADPSHPITSTNATSWSSEIVSMGMELMRISPAAFAAADPEYFDLIDGIMTGRIK